MTLASTQPVLLDRREAAQLLSVCLRTLHTLTSSGQLPCVRLGKRCLRYRLTDIEAFASDHVSVEG